jgi:hypothetical protein
MRHQGFSSPQVVLAVVLASLITIAHHPPAHAQVDPGTSSDAGPFASDNAASDASGADTSDTHISGDSSNQGDSGPDQSNSGASDSSGGSDSSGLSPADLTTGIDLGGGGGGGSNGSSGPSVSPSSTFAAGPFGATTLAISSQADSGRGSGQSTGNQIKPGQVVATPRATGPDQVSTKTQPRAALGPRLLGIWSVADILAFLAALLTAIILAIAAALSGLLQAILGGPQGVIFQTPPEFTFQLGPVVGAWNAMRLIAEAGLALVVVVAGYELMFGHHIGLPSMGPAQVVPRVILGFILIHFSLDWSSGLLQLNNALSHMLLGQVPTDWGVRPGANDLGAAVVWLIEIVMMLLLALSMWLRIALLDVLLPLGPLMLLLWTSPLTSDWGEWWLGLFSSTALVQFFQDIALWLGSQTLAAGGQNASQGIGNRLLAFALLLLVFRIPQLMPAMAASGGTASLLGVSRGVDAIGGLPVLGGALSAPARLMGIGALGRAGRGSRGRGRREAGNGDAGGSGHSRGGRSRS